MNGLDLLYWAWNAYVLKHKTYQIFVICSDSNLQLWINEKSVFRPLDIEVSGKGDAVVLVVDPENLVNVNTDIDLVDAFSDW